MDVVTLLSGGLDSAVVAALLRDEGFHQLPIFIDYGQLAREREWRSSRHVAHYLGLADPIRIDLSGYGATIPSGLTDPKFRIREDAFLPGRNLVFLLLAAAHAFRTRAQAIAIGHLNDATALFPDQTENFRQHAATLLTVTMDRPIRVLAPLASFSKADVIALAREKGIRGTWSCHADGARPCGQCIACLEYPGGSPDQLGDG